MSLAKTFSVIDYCVLGVAIVCSLLTGFYYAYKERHQLSAYRFHRGGGKLRPVPVALSLLVTFESSIFFLGVPAEVYINGSMYWLSTIGMAIGFSAIFCISIPVFYPLQITSVYEYLQRRHGSKYIRQMASVLSTISMVVYAGIVLFGAAIALEAVTNIKNEISIIVLTLLAVAYTSLGGMKAVVVTDTIQGVVMMSSIFAVLLYGTTQVGGIGKVIAINKAAGRLKLVDFDPSPFTRHTFWTLVVGGTFQSIGFSFWQPVIQRMNSTRTIKDAKTVFAVAIPGFIILELLVMVEGLVAYAYFSQKGCDPLASGQISNPNQIMSYTVVDMFAGVPGVPGLFLAAICSATLSTVSSLLSSMSAIASEDIIKGHCKNISDKTLTVYSKLLVLVTGAISVGIALVIGSVKGPITQISISLLGAIDSPLNCIFLMSIFVAFCTWEGLLAGTVVGVVLAFWISSGYNFSRGRKQTPWLPLGPTDNCSIYDNLTSADGLSNMTSATYDYVMTTQDYTNVTDGTRPAVAAVHGLDHLYSISYFYFTGIVLIVGLVTATIVSKLTQPSKPQNVPPELMVSFPRKLCCSSSTSRYPKEEVEIGVTGNQSEQEIRQPLSNSSGSFT